MKENHPWLHIVFKLAQCVCSEAAWMSNERERARVRYLISQGFPSVHSANKLSGRDQWSSGRRQASSKPFSHSLVVQCTWYSGPTCCVYAMLVLGLPQHQQQTILLQVQFEGLNTPASWYSGINIHEGVCRFSMERGCESAEPKTLWFIKCKIKCGLALGFTSYLRFYIRQLFHFCLTWQRG